MYQICPVDRDLLRTEGNNQNIMAGIGDGRSRDAIRSGVCVDVVQKQDQRSGKKTRGVVSDILTNSTFHPHGIKVRLKDGKVGRVCGIVIPEGEGSDEWR